MLTVRATPRVERAAVRRDAPARGRFTGSGGMTAWPLRLTVVGAALVSIAIARPGAATAQATGTPAAAAQDSTLLDVSAARARLVAARAEQPAAAGRARQDPALARYLQGIAQLGRRQLDSAVTPLRAAAAASPGTARYHGDLAYALALLEHWDEAADQYAAAIRLQPANPWYHVGLATVQASQERWQPAAASYDSAVALDSAIIDHRFVTTVSECLEQGGFVPQLITWSRIGAARYPDDPEPWLRLATLLRTSDSTAGLQAIRRFRALEPDHPLGAALYAHYLLGLGEYDSALALARQAARDSALWRLAWPVFLRDGARLFQARSFEQASQVLAEGRGYAPAARRAQFSLFLGYAGAQRLGPLYADAARKKDCAEAHVVDSLETSTRHDLEEGKAVGDSVQINGVLGGVLTQARTRIDELLAQCRKP